MTQRSARPDIVIERIIDAPAEKVYRAFLDPDVLPRWQPPEGGEGLYDDFVAQVGRTSTYTLKEGQWSSRFKVTFLELVEFTRIRHNYAFDMDGPMGLEMEISITLTERDGKTHLLFEQTGIPAPIPKDRAGANYETMFDRLKAFLER